MKAENGIRRLRDNVPTHPPSMTTASCFHFMASGVRSKARKAGSPLLPGAELGSGMLDSEQETTQSARRRGLPHLPL